MYNLVHPLNEVCEHSSNARLSKNASSFEACVQPSTVQQMDAAKEQLVLLRWKNLVLDPHVNRHKEEVEASQGPQEQAQSKHDEVGPVLAQRLVRLFSLGAEIQSRLSKLHAQALLMNKLLVNNWLPCYTQSDFTASTRNMKTPKHFHPKHRPHHIAYTQNAARLVLQCTIGKHTAVCLDTHAQSNQLHGVPIRTHSTFRTQLKMLRRVRVVVDCRRNREPVTV